MSDDPNTTPLTDDQDVEGHAHNFGPARRGNDSASDMRLNGPAGYRRNDDADDDVEGHAFRNARSDDPGSDLRLR